MRRGFQLGASLEAFESSTMLDIASTELPDIETAVLRAMTGVQHGKDRAKRALQLLCDAHAARGGHLYLTHGTALKLAASIGDLAGTQELRSHVRALLDRDRSKTAAGTAGHVTVTPQAEDDPVYPTIQAGGEDYELLALTCVLDGIEVVAGVVALASGKTRIQSVKRVHLLSSLAAHLVDTSDSMATRRAR